MKALASHGVLGIFCALLAWAYWKERGERNKLQEEHAEALRQQQREFLAQQAEREERHLDEIRTMQERMITRTETMAEKHRELVISQQNLLEAVASRR